MGCSSGKNLPLPTSGTKQADPGIKQDAWTKKAADDLQDAVDKVFVFDTGKDLLGFDFSFSIADPNLEGCPLIGCSTGFTRLCGYELNEIVGRNCRFLVDPVPADQIDKNMRKQTKDFCEAVRLGQDYRMKESERESWMPEGLPGDEFFAIQRNARKDGTLFNNVFFMKAFEIGPEMGQEQRYIVALQSEMAEGKWEASKLTDNVAQLSRNMNKVITKLAGMFFMRSSITRSIKSKIGASDISPGSTTSTDDLHSAFSSDEVKPHTDGRFKLIRKLAEAPRNKGHVALMEDASTKQLVAVKQMPNSWVKKNATDFQLWYPDETENPWQDIGCVRFLNSVKFPFVITLKDVFRGKDDTYVVSSFASGGDFFSATQAGEPPGAKREKDMAPLLTDILSAGKMLHDVGIVHRDISLENVLLTKGKDGKPTPQLVDFGMAARGRRFTNSPRGKASYEAPEMRRDEAYDAYLTDMFAMGVVIYSVLMRDYPWQSTQPGACRVFQYFQQHGWKKYSETRRVRGFNQNVVKSFLSTCAANLLEGMLMLDPSKRLTLGENDWKGMGRRSVWDEPWTIDTV